MGMAPLLPRQNCCGGQFSSAPDWPSTRHTSGQVGGRDGPPQLGDQCWGPPWLEEEPLLRGVWLTVSASHPPKSPFPPSIPFPALASLGALLGRVSMRPARSQPHSDPSSACLQTVSTSELPRDFLFPVSKERQRGVSLVGAERRRPPSRETAERAQRLL